MLNGEICVTMSVVDEFALVKASLSRLHAAYPNAQRVLLIDTEAVDAIARWRLHADSRTVIRAACGTYRTERGGAVVELHLRSFMETGAEWWFKMDPDTLVRRPFVSPVCPTSFSGTLQMGLPRPSLQGGCIVGGRPAVSRLLRSEALRSRDLLDYEGTWAKGNGVLLRRAREHGLVSFDFVHAWACERVGVPLDNHPEIKSQWLRPPSDGVRYAITHPHKNLHAVGGPGESGIEECGRLTDLEALLSAILPAKCVIAVVGESKSVSEPSCGRTLRTIVSGRGRTSCTEIRTDSDEAIDRVRVARAQGADFIVVPANARTWFGYCRGFAEHLITHYEVVFWQDDLAIVFDLSRPSLHGPHINWYQSPRTTGRLSLPRIAADSNRPISDWRSGLPWL